MAEQPATLSDPVPEPELCREELEAKIIGTAQYLAFLCDDTEREELRACGYAELADALEDIAKADAALRALEP